MAEPGQCANISLDFEELGPVRCELPESHVGDHKRHILHRWRARKRDMIDAIGGAESYHG